VRLADVPDYGSTITANLRLIHSKSALYLASERFLRLKKRSDLLGIASQTVSLRFKRVKDCFGCLFNEVGSEGH
jgi:hypothetical protein